MSTDQPDFLTEPLRAQVRALFDQFGARGSVRYATGGGADEAVFVVTTAGAAGMNEVELTKALTVLLHRKVWVATYSDIWADKTALFK